MKKFLPYILILTILAGTFAPFSLALKLKNTNLELQKNSVYAEPDANAERTVEIVEKAKSVVEIVEKAKSVEEKKKASDYIPPCGFGSWWGGGSESSIVGCVAQILYYALYRTTSWIFGFSGIFFDWMFDYSVDDESYKTSFVTEGWKIVRDICNIFFIFILLYVAFTLVLGMENANAKGMIVNVIIIGILINFSMFFAKVVIDSGNILARVLYNSETLKEDISSESNNTGVIPGDTVGDEISLSAGLVSKIDPQKIIESGHKVKIIDGEGNSSDLEKGSGSGNLNAGHFILITLLATVVNLIGIFVFISVALIFVSRVIGLWFIMIFAPFAFLSYIVPKMSEIKMVGWKSWISDLVSLSFVAPLFMFMLYLILRFLEKGFGDIIDQNQEGVKLILSVIIPLLFISVMLLTAKKLAKEYSGSIGEVVLKGVNTVAGVAGGVALGAGAVVGRQTLGRGATWLGRQDWLNKSASEGKGWAVGLKKITNVGEKASFDGRKTGFGEMVAKETNVDLDKTSSYVGLGSKRTEGGYVGKRERDIKKEENFGKTLTADGDKADKISADIKQTKKDIKDKKTEIDNAKVVMASSPKNSQAYKNAAIDKAKAEKELREKEDNLKKQEEALEVNKVGRAREYYQYKRKQSGKIVKTPEVRDVYGNIKEYAEIGDRTGEQIGKQVLRGFVNSLKDGGLVGATTMIFAGAGPAIASGLAATILSSVRKSAQEYSGTYNRQVGDTASESPK